MAKLQKSGSMKRNPLKRGKFINKKGPLTTLWEVFRDKKLLRERNEEGLIECQDWKIGLPRCGVSVPSPDLHHIVGREEAPGLYFHHPNLVWLIRETCHAAAHSRNSSKPRAKAQDDEERQMEATPQRDAILGVQGQSEKRSNGKLGRTVFSSVQNRNAEILARESKGRI